MSLQVDSFDFIDKTNIEEYIYKIKLNNIILYIKRISYSVAILYFTDESLNIINIPDEIILYSYENQNIQKKFIQTSINKYYYALCWTDNYIVEYNEQMLLDIKNKRTWNISFNKSVI